MISFPSLRMAVQWKDQVFDSGHDCLQGADVIIAPMRTFPGTITHVILHLYFVSDIAVFVLKRDIKLQLTILQADAQKPVIMATGRQKLPGGWACW